MGQLMNIFSCGQSEDARLAMIGYSEKSIFTVIMVGIRIFFYHLHAYFFLKNNTQRKLRMQYINLPSLWKALPFIVMVKTPCAENN